MARDHDGFPDGPKLPRFISPISPPTCSDELRFLEIEKCHPALHSLFNSAFGKIANGNDAESLMRRLHHSGAEGLLVYLKYKVELDVLNLNGDIRVSYLLEVSNFSMKPVSFVEYPFWFERPQKTFGFVCSDENLSDLPFEIIEGTPNFQKVRIHFPKEIGPLACRSFSISYLQEGNPLSDNFYFYLRPRSITSLLGFSVLAPVGTEFSEQRVMRESPDAFLRDDPPTISVSTNGVRWTLSWEHHRPRQGEMFRSYWCCVPRNSSAKSSCRVVNLPARMKTANR